MNENLKSTMEAVLQQISEKSGQYSMEYIMGIQAGLGIAALAVDNRSLIENKPYQEFSLRILDIQDKLWKDKHEQRD